MKKLFIVAVLSLLLSACMPTSLAAVPENELVQAAEVDSQAPSAEKQVEAAPLELPSATPTLAPFVESEPMEGEAPPTEVVLEEAEDLEESPAEGSEAESLPAVVNPLTGLPAVDPSLLELPPALVSVTNFPVSARPQAGLSFSPYVFELYIGEGMTRFLALFYGEFPGYNAQVGADPAVAIDNQPEIGPVRSGRLPYQAIRKLYNGFLVMASASPDVRETTTDFTNIFGSDSDDINSALIDVTHLQSIAEANKGDLEANLTGNVFDPLPPAGGQAADSLWVFYNFYNQVQWTYDAAAGTYLRYQDNADGSGEFYPAADRLTGEQLASDNVILLFVEHEVLNSDRTLIDVNLLYTEGKAYLFRDGQLYPVIWSTLSGEYEKSSGLLRPIRFQDLDGNPVPLKPGSTWVELVDISTDFKELEPGGWKARFYAP
jgi:hypothetical protein